MRYWWVNQNQTHRQEIGGGYLWSPKRKSNRQTNPFYEFMREIAPGDLVFSFVDTRVGALGIATSYCYESPKPSEFGTVGANWEAIGWKVEVDFRRLGNRVRPKDHIAELRSLLPPKYAPLRRNGDGLQSVYLAEVPEAFGAVLLLLIGAEANQMRESAFLLEASKEVGPAANPTIDEWERRIELSIGSNSSISETDRTALVQARRGQGLFRANVRRVEHACRVTRVDRPEHLIASHAKPWRDADNEERLDGENGLLLTPTVDHLFDKGFISFEGNGDLIVSPVAHRPALVRMGVAVDERVNVGAFSMGQRRFLEYHRENVLRMAKVGPR